MARLLLGLTMVILIVGLFYPQALSPMGNIAMLAMTTPLFVIECMRAAAAKKEYPGKTR